MNKSDKTNRDIFCSYLFVIVLNLVIIRNFYEEKNVFFQDNF